MLLFNILKTKWKNACKHALHDAGHHGVITKAHASPLSQRLLLVSWQDSQAQAPKLQVSHSGGHTALWPQGREQGQRYLLRMGRRGFLPQGPDWTFPWQLGYCGAFKDSRCNHGWADLSSALAQVEKEELLPHRGVLNLQSRGCSLVRAMPPLIGYQASSPSKTLE